MDSSQHSLWCKGHMQSGTRLNLINVYGPRDIVAKQIFWNELRSVHNQMNEEPVCMMGDFNSIRKKEDRANCIYSNRDTIYFNQFLEETGLIELEGLNFSFTWFGPGIIKSRLDRVLVNDRWLSSYDWKVYADHRRNSDHLPLILSCDHQNWGPKPFKAFDDWLKIDETQNIIDVVMSKSIHKSWFATMKEVKNGLGT